MTLVRKLLLFLYVFYAFSQRYVFCMFVEMAELKVCLMYVL